MADQSEDAALLCVRRLADGWTWNETRKAWWHYSQRDEMNVRYPFYEAASEGEAKVMHGVLFGRDVP